MNSREETTTVLDFLRTIEKQKKIITELKLSIKEVKSKHSKEIKKCMFSVYKTANRGESTRNKYKMKQDITVVFTF